MHHIFVNENQINLIDKCVIIDKGDIDNFNHLKRVLRVRIGEMILCSVIPFNMSFDYKTKVVELNENELLLEILEKTTANELPIKLNLYQGLPKLDKLEFIVEKAVELGVYSITPVVSGYCVVKVDEKKIEGKLTRINKISQSAAEQSKRNIIPQVHMPISFSDMIKNITVNKNFYNFLCYENVEGITETKNVIKEMMNSIKKSDNSKDYEINIIIGPEGGFMEKEVQEAIDSGVKIISLGNRILRTETAAITSLSIFMFILSGEKF